MTKTPTIRPTQPDDLSALRRVVAETGLFPPEMLPDMAADFLSGKATQIWLTALTGTTPVGFCFAAPEAMADGVWNMLALAILPARQGEGIGGDLVRHLERSLRARGDVRLMIVDTSGTDAFARTRSFYGRAGYVPEARLRDYWAEGDDKVTFRKTLSDFAEPV